MYTYLKFFYIHLKLVLQYFYIAEQMSWKESPEKQTKNNIILFNERDNAKYKI